MLAPPLARGTQVAAAFAEVLSSVADRIADPAFAGVAGHDYRAALERTQTALANARASYLGDGTTRTLTLSEGMSLARVAALAYGDASRAAEIAALNAIEDTAFIPAGTVLVI